MDAPITANRTSRRSWKSYSEELKAQGIRLVLDEGKSLAEGCRELGVSRPVLRTWVGHAIARRRGALTDDERGLVEQALSVFLNHSDAAGR